MSKNRQKVKKSKTYRGNMLVIREDPVDHLWWSVFAKIVNDF